jgi:RNA polymerase sigma-70 factor (ECF subfamily)
MRMTRQGRSEIARFLEALGSLRLGTARGREVILIWLAGLAIPVRDREDLAQQALESALRSWDKFDETRPVRRGRKAFRAWLNRITVHVVGHYRDKRRLRREELASDPLEGEIPDVRPLAPELLAEDELNAEVLSRVTALARVDPQGAYVLIAYDLDELPMEEIAAAIGVPRWVAYKIRARALAQLRAAAAAEHLEDEPHLRSRIRSRSHDRHPLPPRRRSREPD